MGICFGPGRVTGIGGSSHHEAIKNSLDHCYSCPGSGTDWRLAGRWGGGATLGDKLYRWGCQGPGGQALSGCDYHRSNEQGKKWELKTDKNGHFSQGTLQSGIYVVGYKVKDKLVWETKLRVESGTEARADANFKELIAKQGAAAQEAVKKQEEEKQKVESLKAHVDSGAATMEQARAIRSEIQRAPVDQRAALQQKLVDLYGTAVNEFQAAEKATGENDPNRHIILGRPGDSHPAAGRYQEAADTYQQVVALKPDLAGYYNHLGNALATLGESQAATAAYEKSAALDPANAGTAWRNLGIELYNSNRMKEALEPLKKATELDPKNPQGWYLLGVALVNTMEYKKEGDKYIPILQPGTVEAYQKALDLDP